MFDVLKYKSVVEKVVAKAKAPQADKDDLKQECYMALLMKQDQVSAAANDMAYAASVCRTTIADLGRDKATEVKTESLDNPRTYSKAVKIPGIQGYGVTDEQLDVAIQSLPWEEYIVIYGQYIDGRTRLELARDLGMTPRVVQLRVERGVESLKKYFEDNL